MNVRKNALVSIVTAVVVAGLALASVAQERRGYAFSPVNQYGIALTASYWNPILAYVSEKSGVNLTLKIGRTSADTTSYVIANEVEFVFTNHLFSPEREKMGWRVFGRRNTAPIRSQLIVPAASPITELEQLAGRDVAFPGPEAFVAYKMSYSQLLSRKIDVNVVFAGNHDAAFAQLYAGKVAAVGSVSQLAEGYAAREGKRYRVLWNSEPMNDLALMVSSRVPENDRNAVAKAFVGMADDPKGREILRSASRTVNMPEDTRFIASDAGEYESYRRFYRTAPPQLQ